MIDTIYSDPDFLMHHGVKGMKWGVRHDPEPTGTRTKRSGSSDKGLTESQKKKIAIGAAVVASIGVGVAVGVLATKHKAKVAAGKKYAEMYLKNPTIGKNSNTHGAKSIKNISVSPKDKNAPIEYKYLAKFGASTPWHHGQTKSVIRDHKAVLNKTYDAKYLFYDDPMYQSPFVHKKLTRKR